MGSISGDPAQELPNHSIPNPKLRPWMCQTLVTFTELTVYRVF